MGILSWILFGLLAGFIARWLMPGHDPMGWIVTCLLGIVGAAVGGWIGTQLHWGTADRFDIRSLALAVGGACIVLLIYRNLRSRPVA